MRIGKKSRARRTLGFYRSAFGIKQPYRVLVDGTARAGIEACLTSLIAPGDKVLVPIFGRFGHLLTEIAGRCGAEVTTLECEWGTVFADPVVATAILDRLLHHSQVITIRGDSYRLREKRRAGLIAPTQLHQEQPA